MDAEKKSTVKPADDGLGCLLQFVGVGFSLIAIVLGFLMIFASDFGPGIAFAGIGVCASLYLLKGE